MADFEISLLMRCVMAAAGGFIAILEPTVPFIIICTIAILFDCFSAWQLSRRVKKAHPEQSAKTGGKFISSRAGRVFVTLLKVYAMVMLAHLVQVYIADGLPVNLPKFLAGAVCFWQFWSILENESSCNGAKWARIMQKIMIDKTERHLDIDLTDIKPKE